MKKLLLALCLALALTACGQVPSAPEPAPEVSAPAVSAPTEGDALMLSCSNLNAASVRSEVDDLLDNAGISEARRECFWNHVEQFNSTVDSSTFSGDFETADLLHPAYDPYELQDQWMEKSPEFNGYNCRITAYTLFGDHVTVSDGAEIRDADLFMDIESLEADDSALMGGGMDGFRALFSSIPTENTKDTAVHIQKIQEDWAQRGISFPENNTLTLVTVWFHNQWSETENELFVGHTGILIESCDDLFFVEKVAFQEPYQVVKCASRQELSDYLLAKYGNQWGQETADPFVMENDHPLLATEAAAAAENTYQQISMDKAAALMASEPDCIILDVRTQEEYDSGHIPGAVCVPLQAIGDADISELPDREQLILVYCRSSNRSKQASEKLAAMGYTNIMEFGGIQSWSGEIVTE